MSRYTGFLQLRRGIFEHVRDGRLSLADCAVFSYIVAQADTRTGVWNGSAGALAGELSLSARTARKVLERLTRTGYIKRFAVPGKHICYPILVNKFTVTNGEHRGEQLNATDSTSSNDLQYVAGEHEGEHRGEVGASQKILKKKETKTTEAKPAPDPRFTEFLQYAYASFEAKYKQKPTWAGKDWTQLKALLARASEQPVGEIRRRWDNYAASTDPYYLSKSLSLAFFCSQFDVFIAGPIAGQKGGKPDAASLEAKNRAAAGFGD